MENAGATATLVRGCASQQRLALIQDEHGVIGSDSHVSWRRDASLEIDARAFEHSRHLQYSHPFVTDPQRPGVVHEGFGNSLCQDRFALFQDPDNPERRMVVPFDASYSLKIRTARRPGSPNADKGLVARLERAQADEKDTGPIQLFSAKLINSTTGVSATCLPAENRSAREAVPYHETSFISPSATHQEWSWTPPPSP